MTKRQDRGSALAVAIIIVIMLMSLGIALATFSHPFIRRTADMNGPVLASFAAEAMLEKIWWEITESNYDANGNVWLQGNSGAVPTGVLVYNDVPVGNSRVNVRGYDVGNLFYRFEATATWVDTKGKTQKTTVAQHYRARDSFARYMFFVDQQTISFGTTTVRGFVHENEGINFYFGGAKFYKDVDAVDGFTYAYGADTSNTTFFAGQNPAASNIPMPTVSQIATLHTQAQTGYKFMGSNDLVKIEFMGTQVRMIATSQTGVLLSDQTLPLPSNGLIFVQGNFEVKGVQSGRTTIASMGAGTITDKLIYKDADGDNAYQLFKDGSPVANNDTAQGIKWLESDGYQYLPNPNYNPDPNNTPALGIMLQNDLTIGPMAPWNMEMHAAVYSASGNWHADLTQVKGNLRVNGSLVSRNRGWRYSSGDGGVTWNGWGASGEYIYDENLLNNPPPFYLNVDKPVKGARWIMNKSEVTNPADMN